MHFVPLKNPEGRRFVKDYGFFQEFYVLKQASHVFPSSNKTSTEEVRRIELSRIKSKIRDYALMNDFTFFYTQTLNTNYNRFDLDSFKKLIQQKFKAYKRINKNFIYLIIFEQHKDGAYHLHGLIGFPGIDLKINKNGYYNLEFFTDLGFNSISPIKDKIKISNYILKYLSKNPCKTSSGYTYFHSKGLLLPSVQEIFVNDFSNYKKTYENEFLIKFI